MYQQPQTGKEFSTVGAVCIFCNHLLWTSLTVCHNQPPLFQLATPQLKQEIIRVNCLSELTVHMHTVHDSRFFLSCSKQSLPFDVQLILIEWFCLACSQATSLYTLLETFAFFLNLLVIYICVC